MVHHTNIEKIEIITYSVAAFSCCFSLYVICSFLMFQDLQGKTFLKVIRNIATAEFFMNSVSLLGFPKNGSALCWIQGLGQNYFALAAWFWTVILTYYVYGVIKFNKVPIQMWKSNLICWGLPLILSLLPLTTNNYGSPDPDVSWCLIVARDGHTKAWETTFWAYIAFYIWIFVCTLVMSAMGIRMYMESHSIYFKGSTELTARVRNIVNRIRLYPVAMLFCWLPTYLSLAVLHLDHHDTPVVFGIAMILGEMNGILSALIFIAYNKDIGRRWYIVILGTFFTPSSEGEDTETWIKSFSERSVTNPSSDTANRTMIEDDYPDTDLVDEYDIWNSFIPPVSNGWGIFANSNQSFEVKSPLQDILWTDDAL
jgi:hypothetical protein